MKRAVKIITIFVILSVVISCCSFSVSAASYDPDYSFDDWYASGENVLHYTYPSHEPELGDLPCFGFSELDGMQYFMPQMSSGSEQPVEKPAFYLPPLPSSGLLDYTFVFSDQLGEYWFFTFDLSEPRDLFDVYISISHTDDYFRFSTEEFSFQSGELWYYNDVSKMWVFGVEYTDIGRKFDFTPVMFSELYWWSDFNGYLSTSSGFSSFSPTNIPLEDYPDPKTVCIEYVYKFSVNLDFSFSDLSAGDVFNMFFTDVGFVNVFDMSYMYLSFQMSSGDFTSDYINLFYYNELLTSNYIPADTVTFTDFDVGKFSLSSSSGAELTFSFIIASDDPVLFFPGSLDFVSQGNYLSQKNHNETLDTIKLSSADIVEAIQNSNYELVYGDTGVPYVEPVDTSPVDDYVNSEQTIMGGVYDILDEQIVNKLPSGTADVDTYLKDSVNSFVNNMRASISSISSLFDDIVEASSIMPLMLFVLSFGFAIFMLGRRLS